MFKATFKSTYLKTKRIKNFEKEMKKTDGQITKETFHV